MNARNSILLVDADAKSLRVLEVSLRKVGYDVRTAETAASALQSALTSPPDLVITDTRLPDYDGFDLCRRLRHDPRTQHAILVFLSGDATAPMKLQGIDVGADEFLTKPVLVKEIISRVRDLMERRSESTIGGASLSGTLANMGIVDLLQIMEAGGKSGAVRVASDPVKSGGYVVEDREEGVVFFRQGDPIDAQLGRLRGADAIYRMMLWEDGQFEAQFGEVERQDGIGLAAQDVLLEGLQRVDAWSKHLETLPNLRSRLRVDLEILSRRRAPPPREVQDLIGQFDGRRTLFEVISASPMDELQTLRILAALAEEGALLPADESTGDVEALEAWLASSEPARENVDLPSALEQAMIPSPNTPSEILAARDPGASRVPLTRQTVPSSYVGPLPSQVPATSPPTARPSLRVKRVASGAAPSPGRGPEDGGWDSIDVPRSVAESFQDPTQTAPPYPAAATAPTTPPTPGWPATRPAPPPAPPAPGWPELQSKPAAPAPGAPPVSQRELPTWDLGPRREAPPPVAAPDAAQTSPWAEAPPPPEGTTSASVQAQAAALPQNPGVYRPSETSTFRDDFFAGGADHRVGLDPKYIFAFLVLLVVGGILLVSLQDAPEPPAVPPPVAESPDSPEALAAAAVGAAEAVATATGTATVTSDAEVAADEGGDEAEAYAAALSSDPSPGPQAEAEPEAEPETAPLPARPRGSIRALVREGRARLQSGELGQAEARFREALDLDESAPAALAGQALVYWERRQDDQARSYAERALKRDRRQALAHLVLGLIATQDQDREAARQSYETYLRLDPEGYYAADVRASLETLR